MTNATLTMWFEITSRGTSGDQVMDILYSWKSERDRMLLEIATLEYQDRWIPVEESLPEEYEEVIAWDANSNDSRLMTYDEECKTWSDGEAVFYYGDQYKYITHWKHKPAGPKEVKQWM